MCRQLEALSIASGPTYSKLATLSSIPKASRYTGRAQSVSIEPLSGHVQSPCISTHFPSLAIPFPAYYFQFSWPKEEAKRSSCPLQVHVVFVKGPSYLYHSLRPQDPLWEVVHNLFTDQDTDQKINQGLFRSRCIYTDLNLWQCLVCTEAKCQG